jgi:diacylglycerol O-acyltransferase
LGCSGSAVLLSAVTGALRRYLEQHGDSTVGTELRAIVTVNLRSPGGEHDFGNRFGAVTVLLPLGVESPAARLREIDRRLTALKGSYEPSFVRAALTVLGHAPRAIQHTVLPWLARRATAVVTTVAGPQRSVHVAGSRVKQAMFWVPSPGDLGMGFSIIIFNGQVTFGVMTDAGLVPDPERIVALLKEEFSRERYGI